MADSESELGVEADAGEDVAEIGADCPRLTGLSSVTRVTGAPAAPACGDEGAGTGGVVRERAVGGVARQARRQELAGRAPRASSAAKQFHDGVAVDGEVDGLADAGIVEGRDVNVQGNEPERRGRVQMHPVQEVAS